MREVTFHKGANLIAVTENVGTSTLPKLIDILMGAQNKNLVYLDQETKSESAVLRDAIVEKRIAVEMTLAQRLGEPYGTTVDLKVELFPRGHYFVDGERLSQSNYRNRLNELLFGIHDNIPTFRQLINSFVRVSARGDDNSFPRTLPRASNAIYRSVYDFPFDISDPVLANNLNKLKTSLKRSQESLRQYKRVNAVSDVERQRQVLIALENEYNQVKLQADDIFDAEDYKRNRDVIASVRAEYTRLSDLLSELDYRIERNREALEGARAERKRQANLELSRRFFDEVCAMLPDINKTFEDMVGFNEKLCDNKIAYFEEIEEGLFDKKASLEEEQNELLASNDQFPSLVAQDRIDEYEHLSASLIKLRQEIGKRKEIVDTLERFETELTSMREDISRYSTGGAAREGKGHDYQTMMNSFNKYFTALAQSINGEKPILTYQPDTAKFPVTITELSGSSTGTRKSLIAAFDLAYQLFAIENLIHTPRFVVHDACESVEGEDLHTIIDATNCIEAQYIVAVLKEKLDSSGIPEEDQRLLQILQLAEDDKLFEGKTVEDAESNGCQGCRDSNAITDVVA